MTAHENFLPYIISDDYSRSAYISPVENLYGEARIDYRPMLHEAREQLNERLATAANSSEAQKLIVAMLAKRIIKWSLTDKDKKSIVLTYDNVRRVLPRLLDRFYAIVTGREGGDADPKSKSAEKVNAEADATEMASILGTTVDQQIAEADLKN